jgi:hypothetical protein
MIFFPQLLFLLKTMRGEADICGGGDRIDTSGVAASVASPGIGESTMGPRTRTAAKELRWFVVFGGRGGGRYWCAPHET